MKIIMLIVCGLGVALELAQQRWSGAVWAMSALIWSQLALAD
jgi:hypothetical protein